MAWPTGRMAALVFTAPGVAQWREVAIPGAREGHVLVRVERVGICGTDLALLDGSMGYLESGLTRYPLRPGHEWCGTVAAVDGDVAGIAVGDRVVGEPFLSCGRCALCRAGRRDQCPHRDEIGVRGDAPGAAAQYVAVPAENVAVVPAGLDPSAAVLAEPLVTVLHALSAVRLEAGESLGVIGAGTLGMLAAQVARAAGAAVTVYSRGDRAERAQACGAAFVRSADAPADRHDAVIEASGGEGAVGLAVRLARPAGRVALVGVPGSPEPLDAMPIVVKGLQVTGVLGGIPFLHRAVRLLADGVVNPDAVIDRVFPAARAVEALDLLAGGSTRRPKIMLDFLLDPADVASVAVAGGDEGTGDAA
ncbi:MULTISPECIES: zinc-dependent alcohol dehydrogenase [Microbacterium]|uniref:Zinc-binding alcohol dehydrogenase n=1 Tax=Microbacterium wangchenii TaxID=2541726 RepID=A0ABX5SY28_9MICO|nr:MULTISPECIES: alcohol dehydrogenase catalytic domain-containing protein [Microbacterium]MCK6065839.1 alcohol dehydrogenase catalytic domain-containing protein [Microbacterium sp. EYE_512]QBR90145.1 zinc-binding alcohol dehydrogenase [Microbacterium wangchenii]TXK11839.1 alcohol dehydrogenase catalytic domain-containing protein [Microbacterium wangchenii]